MGLLLIGFVVMGGVFLLWWVTLAASHVERPLDWPPPQIRVVRDEPEEELPKWLRLDPTYPPARTGPDGKLLAPWEE